MTEDILFIQETQAAFLKHLDSGKLSHELYSLYDDSCLDSSRGGSPIIASEDLKPQSKREKAGNELCDRRKESVKDDLSDFYAFWSQTVC